MKNHTKIYLDALGIKPGEFIACETCGCPAVDIHHISPRGMGGDPEGNKDVIENLMALCRTCHENCEALRPPRETQFDIHLEYLTNYGVRWNEKTASTLRKCG